MRKKMKNPRITPRKKKIIAASLIPILLCITGLCILCPMILAEREEKNNAVLLETWAEEIKNPDIYPEKNENKLPEKETQTEGNVSGEELIDTGQDTEEAVSWRVSRLYRDAAAYNTFLANSAGTGTEAGLWTAAALDLAEYGISTGIWGYIDIPSIGITYPIYLGGNDTNLNRGVAHLGGTSLPIGGLATNAVIVGHCGMLRTEMFRHLDQLQEGDLVYVTNAWETLTYQVTKRQIVKPEDTTLLAIDADRDLLTLITCHPYPFNTSRLVLQCEREK